ncbi:hypothetical protein UFOVP349_34 [uncultured Caudovirales phage]|jgi:hypothetical protein|uniref:Uncharacterized protein n=1 Tax=uncultured Caudovirales phage TaxID=2100421 RepID=A0A6J5M2U9_9CAUD|nr:hypothetical protein UFOVP349_34 [uncultured Caudovirales phage]
MSLYMDRALRASLREVIQWEQQNPQVAARDARAAQMRAHKANAALVKAASATVVRTAKAKRKEATP